jgi:hypothetical protein
MPVTAEILDEIERLVERMDDEVEEAKLVLDKDRIGRAVRHINNAIGIKYWMVQWAPPALLNSFDGGTLYEILYDFDAIADASNAWPTFDYWPPLTRQEIIDALKQSLEDIKELEDAFDYNDALHEQINKMISWLEAMIAAFEGPANRPAPKPSNADSRLYKFTFLAKLNPADDLGGWFGYLEGLDRHLTRAIRVLEADPPDTDEALQELELLIGNKHLFLDWVRGLVHGDPVPPDQGEEDLPKPPPLG